MHLPIPNIKQIILSQMNSSGINEMFESLKLSSLGGVDVSITAHFVLKILISDNR